MIDQLDFVGTAVIRYPENRGSFTMMVDHVCHENLTLDKTDWSFDALD